MLPVSRISEISAANGDSTMLLAKTGSFRTNEDGLLTTESGLVLMGWPALPDGSIPTFPRDTSDGLEPIQINVNQFSGEPTTKMDIAINLPAVETDTNASGETKNTSIEYFDNLGRSENLQIQFIPSIPSSGSSNKWKMVFRDTASNADIIGEYTIEFEVIAPQVAL